MKIIITYKSKTGFSKRYAQWIGEELSADIHEVSEVTPKQLLNYDVIIHGGGLYVGGINGAKHIINSIDQLGDKTLVVFASGATPYREETNAAIIQENFTKEQQTHIKFFYMRGGFDYDLLSTLDKLLMILLKLKLKLKRHKTADERGMLAAYSRPVDFTRKKHIYPLIDYVKSINGKI